MDTFGEFLDASCPPSDASTNNAGQANSEDSPASPAQGDPPSVPSVNVPIAPLIVDLALLAPKLSIEGNVDDPVATKEKREGQPTVSDDATAEDAKVEAGSDAAGAAPDPKVVEISLVAVIVPTPPPAGTPVEATSSSIVAVPTSARTEGPALVVAAADLPLPSVDAGVSLSESAKPSSTGTETASTNGTTAPNESAQTEATSPAGQAKATFSRRPIEQAENENAEEKSSKPPMVRLPYAEARPSTGPAVETGNSKAEDKTVKTEAHSIEAPHVGSPAQAQPSTAALHSPEQPADQDAPALHQPHGQQPEHASASARAAFAAGHSDLSFPVTIPQAAIAQTSAIAPALGLHVAVPLASPVQTLWQPASQRVESSDNTIPISGLAVEIVSRVHEGLRRFEIRLDPPELGRIDVRLDVDRGGNVTSRLTVERAETLDLLRRDAPQLERALQHAGLNTEGGLQFSLRDQNFANREPAPQNAPTLIVPDDEPAAAEAARRGYGRLIGLGGGVDIRV